MSRSALPATIRAFAAADVGPDIREALRPVMERLRRLGTPVRWVAEPNWHLTVKFLGDVDSHQLGGIGQAVQGAAAEVPAFEMSLCGLHAFPPERTPRIIAADVTTGAEGLRALHAKLDSRLQALGVAAEARAFLAHLTLGRVQGKGDLERLWKVVAEHAQDDFGTVTVDEIVLFQSELRPEGARYTTLVTAKLGSGGGGPVEPEAPPADPHKPE
jgi:RNA 2',3'-cyclic 3'-phosphodiesterase